MRLIAGLALAPPFEGLQQVFPSIEEQGIAIPQEGFTRGGAHVGPVSALDAQNLDAFVSQAEIHEVTARYPMIFLYRHLEHRESLGEMQ